MMRDVAASAAEVPHQFSCVVCSPFPAFFLHYPLPAGAVGYVVASVRARARVCLHADDVCVCRMRHAGYGPRMTPVWAGCRVNFYRVNQRRPDVAASDLASPPLLRVVM